MLPILFRLSFVLWCTLGQFLDAKRRGGPPAGSRPTGNAGRGTDCELQKSLAELQEKERQRLLLESEKSELSDKLETRKIVDRAKGILQRDLKITEEEAYRRLQRESQQRRRSMRDIAESIVLNDQLNRSGQ